ncbi:hypothetical protein HDV00_008755 [Rhizophlyctis rosea]|nr:hypothetical protein HDV00_008755 [Rhizophlyctis rosea]
MKYTLSTSVHIPRKHLFNMNVQGQLRVPVHVPSPYLSIISENPPSPAGWIDSVPYNLNTSTTETPRTPFLFNLTLEHGTVLHPNTPIPIRFRITPSSESGSHTTKILAIRIRVKQYHTVRIKRYTGSNTSVILSHEIKQEVNGEFWKSRDVVLVMGGDLGQIRDTNVGGRGLLEVRHRLKVRVVTDGMSGKVNFVTDVVVARLA